MGEYEDEKREAAVGNLRRALDEGTAFAKGIERGARRMERRTGGVIMDRGEEMGRENEREISKLWDALGRLEDRVNAVVGDNSNVRDVIDDLRSELASLRAKIEYGKDEL